MEIEKDLKWFARLETGESPTARLMLQQADQVINKHLENQSRNSVPSFCSRANSRRLFSAAREIPAGRLRIDCLQSGFASHSK